MSQHLTTYPAFREAVRAAVVQASGLADAAVVWGQDGIPAADPVIVLTAIADFATSNTPVRSELTESGGTPDNRVQTLSELRTVGVQVRLESINADALNAVQGMSLRLHREVPKGALSEECVLLRVSGTTDHRYRRDGMIIQARALTLECNIVLEDTDPTEIGTIGTVEVSGELSNPTVPVPTMTINEDD
jgi:hypothetical protein